MKREAFITCVFVVCAAALTTAAVWIAPEARRPAIFSDQGEDFFPEFRNILDVKVIEIVEYNETDAVAKPLKVEFRKGKWVLPSHYDYPAQAHDGVAKTAAALIDLKKDTPVSDRIEDHGIYGVIDPLDTKTASLTGRGKHVTLRDGHGRAIVDLILGHPVKEKTGYRYVRIPNQKRVYAVKTDADPSAEFAAWAGGSILRINPAQVRAITVLNYSVSESMGQLVNPQRMVLRRSGESWSVDGGGSVKPAAVQALVSALGGLRVTGVRPKPPELARQLRENAPMAMTLDVVVALRQRGYFITPDGRLLANEGETQIETASGVVYALRFGEIVTGQGEDKPGVKDLAQTGGDNRFLFVTASWDAARAAKYGGDAKAGQANADALRNRFADWFYVISGSDFARLRPSRDTLVSNQ